MNSEEMRKLIKLFESANTTLDTSFKVGDRIELINDVDRFPDFIARKGNKGTIVEYGPYVITVKMDHKINGAEEWKNDVIWPDESFDQFFQEVKHTSDFDIVLKNENGERTIKWSQFVMDNDDDFVDGFDVIIDDLKNHGIHHGGGGAGGSYTIVSANQNHMTSFNVVVRYHDGTSKIMTWEEFLKIHKGDDMSDIKMDLDRNGISYVGGESDTDSEMVVKKLSESNSSQRRLLKTIKINNRMAKIYKDNEWNEIVVKFYTDGKHDVNADYGTNDLDDAIGTAKLEMSR